MQRGSQGEQVKKLQEFLFQQGYTKNRPDGDYGRGTEKVVKAFQKAVGLDATGIVDAKTIETINKIVAETPKEEPAAEPAATQPATKTKSKQGTPAKQAAQPKEEVAKPKAKTESAAKEEAKPAEKAKPVVREAYTSSQLNSEQQAAPASNGNSVSLEQLMKASKNKNNSEQ
jgi:peptidoglycan hydrolase-like protein with peptidoglycan-binding domain